MKPNANANTHANPTRGANLTAMKWVLCAISLLAVFCASGGAVSAASVSDGFMVRAVLLEQSEDGYTVAVLYQNPEAAANSAEVSAPFTITAAGGESLAAAFAALEQSLSAPVSYQLGDYLLLCGTPSLALLRQYAALVQSIGCGRYAAQVCYTATTVSALTQQADQSQTLAEDLLALCEQSEQLSAKLFDASQESFLVPCIEQAADGSFAPLQTSYLLGVAGGTAYDAMQTQLYRLLAGGGGSCDFVMGETCFTISTRVSSRSGSLAGVSDDIASLPTLHLYALVQSASDASPTDVARMALYLEALANTQPALLAQLGISRVEVSLYSLTN